MLDRWLSSLSKTTIAIGAIVLGTFLIVLSDPPHTVCDVQTDILKGDVGKYFFIDPKEKRILKKNRFTSYLDDCRFQNSPGACYRFFSILGILERELENLPLNCAQEIGGIREIKDSIWNSAGLIVRLAWGESPPETEVSKAGWLTSADIATFCRTKRQALRMYGESRWKNFEEGHFKSLPGAQDLPRDEAWSRMLLSVPCHMYL